MWFSWRWPHEHYYMFDVISRSVTPTYTHTHTHTLPKRQVIMYRAGIQMWKQLHTFVFKHLFKQDPTVPTLQLSICIEGRQNLRRVVAEWTETEPTERQEVHILRQYGTRNTKRHRHKQLRGHKTDTGKQIWHRRRKTSKVEDRRSVNGGGTKADQTGGHAR